MSWGVGFCACFHWIVLIFALLMSFLVNFCDFLSGHLLQIIIWVSLDLDLLTRNDFRFVFVDHLSFDLKVGVIVGRFWEIILTDITCGGILDDDGSLLTVFMLTRVLFLFFIVKYFFCDRHFAEVWKFYFMGLGWFYILCFWHRSLLINYVIGLVH